MRRLLLCTVGLLAVGLVVAPTALAAVSSASASHSPSSARSYARFGGDPIYSISGKVLDFAGNPVTGAEVDWGYWTSSTNYVFGGTNLQTKPEGTPADGSFAFTGVSGGHQANGQPSDDLHVFFSPAEPGLQEMAAPQLDFATNNDASTPAYSYVLQPARVDVTVANAPTSPVEVVAGSVAGLARAVVPLTDGQGVASVMPMSSFDDVVVYPYDGDYYPICQAVAEWLGTPISVSAGQLDSTPIALNWNDAKYAILAEPTCQLSGSAGTTVKMKLWGWPAGEIVSFICADGNDTAHPYSATVISQGTGDTYTVPLKVYAKSPVGVDQITAWRSDSLDSYANLWDYFQVCTFKASASSVRAGHDVRLSGKVPGTGKVTLFATTHKVSGQPSSLAAKGWTKLGAYKTKSGAFVTGYLHPKRTTYYVVRYNGTVYEAFTAVVRVTVR